MPILEQLRGHLKRGLRRRQVPGASLAVLHAGQVHAAAAGVTNLDTAVPVTADTLFQIGSITKIFTTTLVLQLVDEGLLDLDVPLRTYLPDFAVGDERATREVTPRHLLTHTSGIDGDLFMDVGRGDRAAERMRDVAILAPSLFPPGERLSYCNIGFALLGHLVGVLRRSTWDEQMDERIFRPLGLRHALTRPEDVLRFRCAMGHLANRSGQVATAPAPWLSPGQAAAGATPMLSAADVMTFVRAHLADGRIPDQARGRILSARSARAMRRRQVTVIPGGPLGLVGWGLGWALKNWDGCPLYGHDGATLGQYAFLRVEPRSGVAMVLLTNGGVDARGLFRDLADRVFGELLGIREPAPRGLHPQRPVDADAVVGTYQNLSATVTIERTPRGLTISSQPGSRPHLSPPMRAVPLRFLDDASAHLDTGDAIIDRTHYQFSAPDAGRFQFLGSGNRLFRRIA